MTTRRLVLTRSAAVIGAASTGLLLPQIVRAQSDKVMQWIADFKKYIDELKKKRKKLIICGDYNICHRAIDIHNPVSNAKSSGFLPEEREWMEQFINGGFIDTFGHFNKDPHHYTWWTYRFGAREKNLGWRIDYTLVSQTLEKKLQRCVILPDAKHSDHCPVLLEIDI